MKVKNWKRKCYHIFEIEIENGTKLFRRFGMFKWETYQDKKWHPITEDDTIDQLEKTYATK